MPTDDSCLIWKPQTYNDDGDGIHEEGEDSPETVREIREKNAVQAAYCAGKDSK